MGTYTRVLYTVTMADLQMKLLRKKIQKRSEKNKERKLLQKSTEDEETVNSNGLEEECSVEPAAACKTDGKLKKKQKKQTAVPLEETKAEETPPVKKKNKKRRKLADTAEAPGTVTD